MSGKWTKGPWEVSSEGYYIVAPRSLVVAAVRTGLPNKEQKANASLIAGSPRTTEALAEVVRVLDSILPPIDAPDLEYHAVKDALGDDYERLKGARVAGHGALEEAGWEG